MLLLASLLLLGYTRRDALREKWLNAQSTERLRMLEGQRDADTLIHVIYSNRLVIRDSVTDADGPATRAIESVTANTPPDLACRAWSLAGYVAARSGETRMAEERLQRAAGFGRDDIYLVLGTGILAARGNQIASL